MSEKTAGQAFREALHERWTARGHCTDNRPWDALPEIDREDLDAAARAAAVTAWRLLDEARAGLKAVTAERDELRAHLSDDLIVWNKCAACEAMERGAEQVRAELDRARDDFLFERKQVVALRQVLTEVFTCLNTADMSLLDADQVDEWRERAGIEAS